MRFALLVVLLAVVVVFAAGCTEEQEATVEQGAGYVEGTGRRIAPFLPPPFNWIVHGITVIAAGTGAVLAKRRGARADTLEIRVRAEQEVKHKLARAGGNLEEAFEALLADEEYSEDVKKALLALKKWKQNNPWSARAIGVLDGIREGVITVDQLTSDAIARVTADTALNNGAVTPTAINYQ